MARWEHGLCWCGAMLRNSHAWPLASLLLIQLFGRAASLREVQLMAPQAVLSGATARLICDYDLEEAALYSIKWYRGDQEFYRYVPKESPPTRVFSIPALSVDVSESDARQVTLLDMQRQLSGLFKCEVSADAPLFHTVIKSAYITVVECDRSVGGPTIMADKLHYTNGEPVRANCTSHPSYPPANITWYLNGLPVEDSGRAVYQVEVESNNSLLRAVSFLELEANRSGRLRLRCDASLFNVYRRASREIEIRHESPRPASVLAPGRSGCPPSWCLAILLGLLSAVVALR